MSGPIEDSEVVKLRQLGLTYRDIMAETGLKYHKVQRILTMSGMTGPHYKYQRDDVIRTKELNQILAKSGEVDMYDLPGEAWQCLVSIMWLYGKRISEIVSLKTTAIRNDLNYLTILFLVLKKRSTKDPGIQYPFTKRVTLENPYTEYVIDWWNSICEREEFLFPRSQTKMGYIYRQYAHEVLKSISPRISSHLFRHSLATHMAESGATAYELVNWFDWDRTDTALEYIKRSGQMTQRLSNRKW